MLPKVSKLANEMDKFRIVTAPGPHSQKTRQTQSGHLGGDVNDAIHRAGTNRHAEYTATPRGTSINRATGCIT